MATAMNPKRRPSRTEVQRGSWEADPRATMMRMCLGMKRAMMLVIVLALGRYKMLISEVDQIQDTRLANGGRAHVSLISR